MKGMPTGRDEARPGRPARNHLYPWYDSDWLAKYEGAKTIIRTVRPGALNAFVDAFRVFHTRPDFEPAPVERPFDDETMQDIRQATALLGPKDLELREAHSFGRFVVQDHPFFTELQRRVVPLVSDYVAEDVDPTYNFLSLYTSKGVCPVHMDAPGAKWTLDLCVEQSAPWPIYFSDVRPWPDAETETWPEENWQDAIKRSPAVRFTPHTLHPGQAVIFSGSSQWHYRDAMPDAGPNSFCTLLFLHFIPRGTSELLQADNWARLFSIPELGQIDERGSGNARPGPAPDDPLPTS